MGIKRRWRLSTAMGKPDTRRAPPLAVPLLFMGTALLYGAVGFLLAAHAAPALVAGRFGAPQVLASVHALTLGFISMSMMGALYQWLPVITGQELRPKGALYAHYVAWTLGVLAFITGLYTMTPSFLATGGLLLATGAGLFIGVAFGVIRRAPDPGPPIRFVASALIYLGLTVVLGGVLDAHLMAWGTHWPAARILRAHIVVAVGGWVGLTLIGVSYRLFPMFTVAPPLVRHADWVLGLLHAGIFLGAGSLLSGWLLGVGLAVALGSSGLILYVVDLFGIRRASRLKKQDPAVSLMSTAMASLLLALSLGLLALATRFPPIAYTIPVWLLGWFFFSILGFGQKIWPFMAWVQESRRRDARTLPHVPELWPDWQTRWFWRVGVVGLSILALGFEFGTVPLLEGGAEVLAATEILALFAMLAMLYRAQHRAYPPGSRRE